MPSKGVNYYFYVSNPGTSITATEYDNVKKSVSWTLDVPAGPGFQTGHVEVDYSFSFSGVDGSFGWQTVGTTPALSGLAIIDPVTGNMDGGNLSVMMNTPSFSAPGFALSYGFYDAGPGYGDLTNQDQAYAYLTPSMNGWMGRLVAENPAAAAQPFNRSAFPAPMTPAPSTSAACAACWPMPRPSDHSCPWSGRRPSARWPTSPPARR